MHRTGRFAIAIALLTFYRKFNLISIFRLDLTTLAALRKTKADILWDMNRKEEAAGLYRDFLSEQKKEKEKNEEITVAKEAVWLYEKFGDGAYDDVLGLCKVVDISEIEEKGWSLTPGAYVGVAPVEDDGVDFEERMAEIHRELLSLQAESNDLTETISKNMKEMGL